MAFKPELEGTQVDLGEDLLQQQLDEFEKALSFFRENMLEDAKKIARKLVRQDPHHFKAQDLLEKIQVQEFEHILRSDSIGKKQESEQPEIIISFLERDLHIDLQKPAHQLIPDLFKNYAAYHQYRDAIVRQVQDLDPRFGFDLGVAFLEMGLLHVAQGIFEFLVKKEKWILPASYLLAYTLILNGKSIEATLLVEPIVRDYDVAIEVKIDFLYLMGFAFEKLEDSKKAKDFYKRVFLINPKYRDVAEKVHQKN